MTLQRGPIIELALVQWMRTNTRKKQLCFSLQQPLHPEDGDDASDEHDAHGAEGGGEHREAAAISVYTPCR